MRPILADAGSSFAKAQATVRALSSLGEGGRGDPKAFRGLSLFADQSRGRSATPAVVAFYDRKQDTRAGAELGPGSFPWKGKVGISHRYAQPTIRARLGGVRIQASLRWAVVESLPFLKFPKTVSRVTAHPIPY